MTNPLVEALTKNKSANDYGGDLHTRKSSHVSVPAEALEYHFAAGDMNLKAQTNQTYLLCVGVVCSSSDDHDVRFKQITKPYLEDQRVFDDGQASNDDANAGAALDDKPPMVRQQVEPVA